MTFEGFQFASRPYSKVKVGIGMVVIVSTWFVLTFAHFLPSQRDFAWGLWCAVTATAIWRHGGPQTLHRGQGSVYAKQVIWDGMEGEAGGTLLRRWDVPSLVVWGPRVFWIILMGISLALAASGQDPTVVKDPGLAALGLMLLWQAWLTPLYRTILTVHMGSGRKKIYVDRFGKANT